MNIALGLALSLVASVCIAATSVCIRLGTADGRSFDAMVVVLLMNVIVFVPLSIVLYYPDYSLTPISILAFVSAGLVGTLLGRALFFDGIKRIGASRAEPIKGSMPLHASLIAVLVLGETLTPGHFAGILLIVAGVSLISWESRDGSDNRVIDTSLVSFAFPLAAAVFFGIDPIFAKIGFGEGTPVLVGLSIKTVTATVGVLGYLQWTNALSIPNVRNTANVKWFVAGGIMNSLFLLTSYAAYEIVPVSLAVPIVQMSPILVTGISYAFLQDLEQVNRKLATGVGIVVLGAVFVTLFGH